MLHCSFAQNTKSFGFHLSSKSSKSNRIEREVCSIRLIVALLITNLWSYPWVSGLWERRDKSFTKARLALFLKSRMKVFMATKRNYPPQTMLPLVLGITLSLAQKWEQELLLSVGSGLSARTQCKMIWSDLLLNESKLTPLIQLKSYRIETCRFTSIYLAISGYNLCTNPYAWKAFRPTR